MNAELLKRAEKTFTQYAKAEPIRVEQIGGALYAFGSELACLRIFHAYRHCVRLDSVRFAWSENLRTFYFSLELRHGDDVARAINGACE